MDMPFTAANIRRAVTAVVLRYPRKSSPNSSRCLSGRRLCCSIICIVPALGFGFCFWSWRNASSAESLPKSDRLAPPLYVCGNYYGK